MKTTFRIVCLVLSAGWGAVALTAEPVSRREVFDAIAVLEKDVTGDAAPEAAAKVARFGEESPAVLIVIGEETMPWLTDSAPPAETAARAMLTAAYFAGNIKAQLEKRRSQDDPYAGWLFLIKAYRQIQKKQAQFVIPEVEAIAEQEKAGLLRQRADDIRRRDEERERRATVAGTIVDRGVPDFV